MKRYFSLTGTLSPRLANRQPREVAGIFVATLVNHAIAGAIAAWLTKTIGPDAMRWVLAISFIAMAAWMLESTIPIFNNQWVPVAGVTEAEHHFEFATGCSTADRSTTSS